MFLDALKSKAVLLSMEVQQNTGNTGSRRKRDTGDLSDYVGGTFDDSGNAILRVKVCLSMFTLYKRRTSLF
jgi:hypothetical protein